MISKTLAIALALIFAAPGAAWSAQYLIPTPYPSGVTGAAPLDPEPQIFGGPQRLVMDPYPQNQGEFSQGNPPVEQGVYGVPRYYGYGYHHFTGSRRHGRYRRLYRRRELLQRLIPSIYKRKYRVDRRGR